MPLPRGARQWVERHRVSMARLLGPGRRALLTAAAITAITGLVITFAVQRFAYSPLPNGHGPTIMVEPMPSAPQRVGTAVAAPEAAPAPVQPAPSTLSKDGGNAIAEPRKTEAPDAHQLPDKELTVEQECPTAQSARSGFMVERGDQWKSEVLPGEGPIVRNVVRSRDGHVLETSQFEGLFPLERLDRGRRTVFRPLTNLDQLFPLERGKTLEAKFEVDDGSGQGKTASTVLTVTGKDGLDIGPCKYEVFTIERREARGESPPQLKETDYFSADLKLILGKSYKDKDGVATLVQFDRIHPTKSQQ